MIQSLLVSFRVLLVFLVGFLVSTNQAVAQPSTSDTHFSRSSAKPTTGLLAGSPTITTTDGVKLYAKVEGQGLPCVFIHGGPGSGSEVIEKLAGKELEQRFQMIYLDQRGSGRSASDPLKDYTLARLVQDLEDLRQQLHLTKWVVMSHSFGGIIATAYARKYPERVQGLILVNSILNLPASMESTVAYGYPLLPAQGRPPLDPTAPLPQRYGMVMSLLNQYRLINQLMYAHDSTAQHVKQAQQGIAANRDFATVVTQTAAIMDYVQDFTPATSALLMPVLVVTGQDDYVVGPDQYKAFRFPHQQVVVLAGKHFAFLDNPKGFDEALASFAHQLALKK
ncbi:alpha/beta hydrolase [Hymenobacter sp. YC55]|uniref:alpha/beta fold hydrolase n=1 Tax=Hymenobacter sp. YC55 TaxID=3034019 RepID=UPI0023F8C580|nr:alpha/beta hydrolase [Hymenobacter sp. YC55]MDF7815633.1 alpha/beta hydrolase [Hymenobacter sp. YC55]